ncbi:MAG: flagellin lysine-N-methylase, partial [Clostridia bacterium]|nr:flagellin lysine-N-methylase [Clostridia bacterium]
DDDTLMLYDNLATPLGEKIRANLTGDVPHFKLADGDRCPFLMENGLCEIIAEYGEDAICDICYLHPRFKNFYSNFTETGLGLACEEAARIILFEKDKFFIEIPKDAGVTKEEQDFFQKREEIFSLLTDRNIRISERFYCLAEKFGLNFEFSLEKLVEKYKSLEILDKEWLKVIDTLNGAEFDGKIFEKDEFQLFFEQLSVYFIFRHLADSVENGVKFALVSCYFIGAIIACNMPLDWDKIIDIVRMYSAEIEYAYENTQKVMML